MRPAIPVAVRSPSGCKSPQWDGVENVLIETTSACNFRCPGCYMNERFDDKMLFPLTLLLDILEMTRPGTVTFLGGEPLLWPHLRDAVRLCHERRLQMYVASNCALLTVNMARYLYEHDVSVIGKLNIGDPEDEAQLRLQADLIGASLHDARRMIDGLSLLMSLGYRSPKLNVANLVRLANVDLVGAFLKFCLEHDVRPFLELSCNNDDLSQTQIRHVAAQVREYYKGILFPPHFMSSCWHFDNSLYFRANGDVQACSGNRTVLANCMDDASAITHAIEHPILVTRRDIVNRIKGPCKRCDLLAQCRGGCRAYAEQTSLTHSYRKCWRSGSMAGLLSNSNKQV